MLYIVSTPIGNLGDVTLRAVEILKIVDYILCEDTRITGKLLNHFGIQKKMEVFNDFNEEKVIDKVLADLKVDMNIALVSDAGTPLVSDPGFKLVREARSDHVRVESIPGPSAAISALTISGLPTDKFIFLGFLPKKNGKRLEILKNTMSSGVKIKSTIIMYESPFRILKTLAQIKEVFGDIEIVVIREMTKIHEDYYKGKISEFKMNLKGEFVLLW